MEVNILIRIWNYEMEEHKQLLGVFDSDHIEAAEAYAIEKYPNDDIYYETVNLNDIEII